MRGAQSLEPVPAACSQRARMSNRASWTWWQRADDQPSGRWRQATVKSSERFLMEYATPTPESTDHINGWVDVSVE